MTDSAKRFSYLLGLTDLFRHFIGANEEFKAAMEEAERQNKQKKIKDGEHRRRKTEKEEDDELLQDEDSEGGGTVFRESPACKSGLDVMTATLC